VFLTDYDEIKLKKTIITSFQWRHRHYVTEKCDLSNVTSFFHFGPLPIKISGYVSGKTYVICLFVF